MITVKSAKKTLTGNFEINGYCLMDDEKPTENIANGSKLWELNSGDKYVFDEENTEWIKLKNGGGSVVTQEVLTGPLSTIFSDNGYTVEKFEALCNDIQTGKAAASMDIAMNGDHMLVFLMPIWTDGYSASVLFANILAFRIDSSVTLTHGSQVVWMAWNDIVTQLRVWDSDDNEGAGAWVSIDSNNIDSVTSNTFGIDSFTLTITRFNDV